jgi:sulfur carrier protein ThiS
MPKLKIKVFGTLQQSFEHYDPAKGMTLTVPDGSTVADLMEILGLEARQVGMVALNGVLVAADRALGEGDELKIFQPISGG